MSEVNLGLIDLCTLCIMKQMSLKDAAESLNTSVSTLQRKLKREGTTYSDLKLKVMPDTSQQQATAPYHDKNSGDVKMPARPPGGNQGVVPIHTHHTHSATAPTKGSQVASVNARKTGNLSEGGGAQPPDPIIHTHSVSSGGDDSGMESRGAPQFKLEDLPKRLQNLIAVTPFVKDAPSWMGPYILETLKADEKISTTETFYSRPEWLYDHQEEFIEIEKKGNIFLFGMRQLTGKTTGTHVANLEMQHASPHWKTHCMAKSIELSKELFIAKITEEPLYSLFKPYFHQKLKESYSLKNHSESKIFPMSISAVQGPTANILWIDEIDKIIQEKAGREALAGLFPQLLKKMVEGHGHLWITCNLGTSRQFHRFMHVLEKLGYPFFPVVEILEPMGDLPRRLKIRNKHIPSPRLDLMSEAEKEQFFKDFMYKMLEALMGEQYAKALILNEEDWSKDPFNPKLLDRAFEPVTYEHTLPLLEEPTPYWKELVVYKEYLPKYHWSWVSQFPDLVQFNASYHPNIENSRVGYIDPGFQHALAFLILGKHKSGQIMELFAQEWYGGEISEENVKNLIYLLCRAFRVDLLIIESNSGGLWWHQYMENRGITCIVGGFGTANPKTGDVAGKHFERTHYERSLKRSLENDLLRLITKKLRSEWDAYDLSHKDKEEGKGDLVDCLLQANWESQGGVNSLIDEINAYGDEMVDQVAW